MGIPVLILGDTGSGKTYSIKNFDTAEVGIFSVEKNRLPFKKKFDICKNASYETISYYLRDPKRKAYVVDDSQYLLVNELFDRVNENGYAKFTDMAVHFRDLVHNINRKVPEDVIVYFLHHVDRADSGRIKAKTIGKMLDEKLTLEGCFDIVLLAENGTDEHYFVTQSEGYSTAKSPEGMFEPRIPNDLKLVDTAIREYYDIKGDKE